MVIKNKDPNPFSAQNACEDFRPIQKTKFLFKSFRPSAKIKYQVHFKMEVKKTRHPLHGDAVRMRVKGWAGNSKPANRETQCSNTVSSLYRHIKNERREKRKKERKKRSQVL